MSETPNKTRQRIATRQLYWTAGLGLSVAAFLLYPGNPVWDLSRTRVPNTLLVYASLAFLLWAMHRDRLRYVDWFAAFRPRDQYLLAFAAPLVAAFLLIALHTAAPAYVKSLAREYGLIEPFTFALYWLATWSTLSWMRWRRARDMEHKPYQALTVVCAILLLEECDYLGIFGGIIGRIEGVYVGTLHDLVTLWYRTGANPLWAACAIVVIVAAGIWLWRRGYGSRNFVRNEGWSMTSLPLIYGVALLVLAQLADIDRHIFDRAPALFCRVCEETLEMFFALSLVATLWLKIARDFRESTLHGRRDA